jgi:WD40 repeat protein
MTAMGGVLCIYRGHRERAAAPARSPESMQIASGSWDRTVLIWEAATGRFVGAYHSHAEKVTAVAWSPDGRYLASGSDDMTVRI